MPDSHACRGGIKLLQERGKKKEARNEPIKSESRRNSKGKGGGETYARETGRARIAIEEFQVRDSWEANKSGRERRHGTRGALTASKRQKQAKTHFCGSLLTSSGSILYWLSVGNLSSKRNSPIQSANATVARIGSKVSCFTKVFCQHIIRAARKKLQRICCTANMPQEYGEIQYLSRCAPEGHDSTVQGLSVREGRCNPNCHAGACCPDVASKSGSVS